MTAIYDEVVYETLAQRVSAITPLLHTSTDGSQIMANGAKFGIIQLYMQLQMAAGAQFTVICQRLANLSDLGLQSQYGLKSKS